MLQPARAMVDPIQCSSTCPGDSPFSKLPELIGAEEQPDRLAVAPETHGRDSERAFEHGRSVFSSLRSTRKSLPD